MPPIAGKNRPNWSINSLFGVSWPPAAPVQAKRLLWPPLDRRSERAASLYDLAGDQCLRDREAKRAGGLEVDDQLDFFHHLLDWQVGRLGAFEDLPGVAAQHPVTV